MPAAIETTRPQQRRIEHVRPVRSGNNDNPLLSVKPVHFHKEGIKRLLPLVMTTPQSVTPVASNGIDLVNKDKAGGLFLALLEHVADAPRRSARRQRGGSHGKPLGKCLARQLEAQHHLLSRRQRAL